MPALTIGAALVALAGVAIVYLALSFTEDRLASL